MQSNCIIIFACTCALKRRGIKQKNRPLWVQRCHDGWWWWGIKRQAAWCTVREDTLRERWDVWRGKRMEVGGGSQRAWHAAAQPAPCGPEVSGPVLPDMKSELFGLDDDWYILNYIRVCSFWHTLCKKNIVLAYNLHTRSLLFILSHVRRCCQFCWRWGRWGRWGGVGDVGFSDRPDVTKCESEMLWPNVGSVLTWHQNARQRKHETW